MDIVNKRLMLSYLSNKLKWKTHIDVKLSVEVWFSVGDWITLFMVKHLSYTNMLDMVLLWQPSNKRLKKKPLCNRSFANSEFAMHTWQHAHTHTLTTPKKPARNTASFLAKLRTWSAFCVYELTSDSSLPKARTVRMLLIRSSANCSHSHTQTILSGLKLSIQNIYFISQCSNFIRYSCFQCKAKSSKRQRYLIDWLCGLSYFAILFCHNFLAFYHILKHLLINPRCWTTTNS